MWGTLGRNVISLTTLTLRRRDADASPYLGHLAGLVHSPLISFVILVAMSVKTNATIASFGGKLLKLSHQASTTNCEMAFNLYLPPQATSNSLHKVPLLIWLSGLTCTGDNCAEKGFFQHGASKKGIAVLYPDTSPRTLPLRSNPYSTKLTHNSVQGG